MKTFWGLLAGATLTVLSCASVHAADLYGGRGSLKDYDYTPPEPEHRIYLRLDGGYSLSNGTDMIEGSQVYLGNSHWDDAWTIGGGVGMYFSHNFRGDITYDHRFESNMYGFNSVVPGDRRFGLTNDLILANLYYDFDFHSHITPYIGAGIGAVNNSTSRGIAVDGCGCVGYTSGSDNWHAAGALMAGFTMKLHERWALDAGYRFLYLGTAKTGAVYAFDGTYLNNGIQANDLTASEFRVGLRYDIR